MSPFQPLEDRVVIRPLEADSKTPGGLVLPDQAQKRPNRAVVEAVGPGRMNDNGKRLPMMLKVGQRVLVPPYGGEDVEEAGETYKILREADVLAVLPD